MTLSCVGQRSIDVLKIELYYVLITCMVLLHYYELTLEFDSK